MRCCVDSSTKREVVLHTQERVATWSGIGVALNLWCLKTRTSPRPKGVEEKGIIQRGTGESISVVLRGMQAG